MVTHIGSQYLVVVSHDQSVDDLLLHPIILLLSLGHAVHLGPRDAPLAHRRCGLVRALARDADALQEGALFERHELDVVVRVAEVEEPEAGVAPLVRGRLEDAVDGRLVDAAGEHLQRVAGVDDLERSQVVSGSF